jgi:hypothetical protein
METELAHLAEILLGNARLGLMNRKSLKFYLFSNDKNYEIELLLGILSKQDGNATKTVINIQ